MAKKGPNPEKRLKSRSGSARTELVATHIWTKPAWTTPKPSRRKVIRAPEPMAAERTASHGQNWPGQKIGHTKQKLYGHGSKSKSYLQ